MLLMDVGAELLVPCCCCSSPKISASRCHPRCCYGCCRLWEKRLGAGGGRAARLLSSKISHEDRVRELYHVAYSREPRGDELSTAVAYLIEPIEDAQGKPVSQDAALRQNLQDLIWALMNTKEFLFNH